MTFKPSGRQRSAIVYTDHIAIDRMMRRSPPFRRNASSVARLPSDRIVNTPASDTAMPATCSGVRRSRRNTHDIRTIITGMNELRMTPLVAVV